MHASITQGWNGARGLSLFIVEKDSFPGHSFEMKQPSGGLLQGDAIPTLGYRGMHSYMLNLDKYFVPAENLVGGEAGLHKGFYLQMAGFAAGRLQTGGRATGLLLHLKRVASVKCRAEASTVDGQSGYILDGAKAWCTFAGRANIIALLARTNPDTSSGARGLSLFIVEKDSFPGHSFEMKQPSGGVHHAFAPSRI